MQNVTLIAIDPAKHSFHVHCQHRPGFALLRKKSPHTQLMSFLGSCQAASVVMASCVSLPRGIAVIRYLASVLEENDLPLIWQGLCAGSTASMFTLAEKLMALIRR